MKEKKVQMYKAGELTYTKKQVAAMFHKCTKTVQGWVDSGELKGIRIGTGTIRSGIVFTAAQIEEFVEMRRMKNLFLTMCSDCLKQDSYIQLLKNIGHLVYPDHRDARESTERF